MEPNHTYFMKVEDYGKVIVNGTLLPPIKKEPDFEEKHGEPEIGCVVRVLYDKTHNAHKVEVIKRVSRESQVIYG